jgi:Flp pilus assembly pilin Flp
MEEKAGVTAIAYALIVAATSILFLVYFVCFLRILARLSGLGGARLWIANAVSLAVLTAAVGIGAFFQLSLMQGIGQCSEEQTAGWSMEHPPDRGVASRLWRPST